MPKKKTAAKKTAAKKTAAKKTATKKAGFAIRSLQAAVEQLAASRPDEKLKAFKKVEHYDSLGAWSFDPIGKWAKSPPYSVLYLQRDPLRYSATMLTDPDALLSYASFGSAVGTWNASGDCAWQSSEGEWIIAEASLLSEQADDFEPEIDVVFALWKVEEGWAAAVWRPTERDLLARLMGFPKWPKSGWKDCRVWFGE